ncbi:hypothetical protein J3998_04035 [Thiomicrorhabdus sp. 6S2-11]|uniref:Lipoprotein n=1 Tax=Thiomicrorhabdus marina TaxID=2818442 RepID=A0ABS3Q371_9GAMM|nr:hypothetical protein [Thiomicrorhabdus marina]MBO1926736.1 hypothetical protein [Thiomicrorhabdus marina]
MNIKFFLALLVLLQLSGCMTTSMKGGYSSQVDPEYSFSKDKSIAVRVFRGEGNNSLETKHYVGQIVDSLKKKGFKNVYLYKDLKQTEKSTDIELIVNVYKRTKSYQYQSANYGMVNSGQSHTNCTGYGNTLSCTNTNLKTYGVTGYSPATGHLTGYYFMGYWIDDKKDEKIMFTLGSSYEKGCSDNAMYKFLIEQTIERLDFDKPNKYEYSVEMPENYSCK